MAARNDGLQGHKSDKIWRDALHRAVKRVVESGKHKGTKKLEQLTEKTVEMGLGGDIQALKEIGDRLDGKSPQHISGSVTHSWETVAKAEFDGWLTGLFEPAVTETERERPN